MTIKELAGILACQKCKGDLMLTDKEDGLSCMRCMITYPIRDGIPVMIIEEATPLKQ